MIEGDGFIAPFVSGLILCRQESGHRLHTRLHDFSQAIEHALTAVLLMALGAAIPALLPATWEGAAVGAALLFVIRPIVGLCNWDHGAISERMVVAFFGVRGIGSIYYLAYAGSHAELTNEAELCAIVAFTILLSTVVHGFTAGVAVERVTENEEELAKARSRE